MHGIPQAIKDLAETRGLRTTSGSPMLADFVPDFDALMVSRMKRAGCLVIGKTNVPEFGLGSHTFNEVFGPTRNPYDLSRSAGGSSGGAAVALATRMLPVADGSDYMGSLRNPAAWNNVFGFRPSQGRVPSHPARDHYLAQMGTEGPMGRRVIDVAMLLGTQAGFDRRGAAVAVGPAHRVRDRRRRPRHAPGRPLRDPYRLVGRPRRVSRDGARHPRRCASRASAGWPTSGVPSSLLAFPSHRNGSGTRGSCGATSSVVGGLAPLATDPRRGRC